MSVEYSENVTRQEVEVNARALPEVQVAPQDPNAGAVAISIPITQLAPNPNQPRAFFDELEHKWLTESIAKNGVLQPILVRPVAGNEFMIIAGERRYRAAKAAGYASVPAVVVSEETRTLEEIDVKELALMENLQRSALNDYEVALGVTESLRQRLGFDATDDVIKFLRRMYNKTLREGEEERAELALVLFRQLGRNWQTFATTQLNVFSLHIELQQQLRLGKLDLSKARVLNRIADDEARAHLMWSAIANGWTRAQLRREIADLNMGRILKRSEETRRAEIASRMTSLRKHYVKVRRVLPAAVIAHVDAALADLESFITAAVEDGPDESKAA